MEIKTETQVIDVSRLYNITEYSKLSGFPASTVNYKMLTGKLPFIEISGLKFIIASDEDLKKKKGVK